MSEYVRTRKKQKNCIGAYGRQILYKTLAQAIISPLVINLKKKFLSLLAIEMYLTEQCVKTNSTFSS